MKKRGLILLVLVVAIAAVVLVQSANAGERENPYPNGTRWDTPSQGYYYYPGVDLRGAHRDYWDEGLVDELGKVITLPFTLPMRVKAEWKRLDAKASHWEKVKETYEKGFPPSSALPAQASPPPVVEPKTEEVRNLETELQQLKKEIAEAKKELGKIKDP